VIYGAWQSRRCQQERPAIIHESCYKNRNWRTKLKNLHPKVVYPPVVPSQRFAFIRGVEPLVGIMRVEKQSTGKPWIEEKGRVMFERLGVYLKAA
jgi:hypothetical protein